MCMCSCRQCSDFVLSVRRTTFECWQWYFFVEILFTSISSFRRISTIGCHLVRIPLLLWHSDVSEGDWSYLTSRQRLSQGCKVPGKADSSTAWRSGCKPILQWVLEECNCSCRFHSAYFQTVLMATSPSPSGSSHDATSGQSSAISIMKPIVFITCHCFVICLDCSGTKHTLGLQQDFPASGFGSTRLEGWWLYNLGVSGGRVLELLGLHFLMTQVLFVVARVYCKLLVVATLL